MPASLITSVRASCSGFSRALAILLIATACAKSGKPIVSVDVVDRTNRIDKKKIEERAIKAAETFKGFAMRPAKPEESAHQLSVRVLAGGERPAVGADGGGPIEGQMERGIIVELTLSAIKGHERFEGDAQLVKNVPATSTFDDLAIEALDEAARSLASGIKLAEAGDKEVLAAISSDDRGLKKRAIIMAGERKLKDALPPLMELVRNEAEDDHDLVLKAIGALMAIGDERAVSALIDAGRRRTSAYLSQILFAVAQLGGKEAEAYLFTVSNGHADPEIRKNAAAALDELEQKRGQKPE